MKIKQKLIFSYLAISLLGAMAGYLGIQTLDRVQTSFDRIADQTIPIKNELSNLERSVDDLVNCSLTIIFLNQNRDDFKKEQSKLENKSEMVKSIEAKLQEEIEETERDKKIYQEALSRYKSLITLYFPGEIEYLNAIEKSSQKIFNISEELIRLDKNSNSKIQVFTKQEELDLAREEFKEAIQAAIEHERNELEERQADLHSILKTAVRTILNVSFYNVLLAIIIGILVSISISKPIQKLKTAAIAIGKGKLGTKINLRSKDELGILAHSFNKMAEDLQQYITDLKQAQESKALMATALENVADAIEITDSEARYLYINPAFEKITGYQQQEVLGKTPAALLRSGKHDEEFYQEMFDTVARKQIWHGVLTSKHKNGTLYEQEATLSPILNEADLLTHIVAVKRDITDRKQFEATLREAERRWRTLLENVRLVVVGLDLAGNIEYVNPFFLELSGYTQEETIGKNWFENFLPPHQRKQVQGFFLEVLEQNFQHHYQNPILTKSGEEKTIAWNNTLLRTPQGEIIGTMSIGEDITERQAIERMKDEFVSVVSHELRTPLASIQGALSLLASGLMSAQSDKGRRVIEIAAESVDRLVLLVNDILELERLELGKIQLSKKSCNVSEMMLKARETMQIMANRAGITIVANLQDIELYIDRDRILQVLTNLLGNAIKFSPQDSTVWLNVKEAEGMVLFEVKDKGRGIPAKNLDSIFERFHQVDASDSRKKGGTGLGLAICRSIIQQHGGQIWVESVLGEGSSFYFTLPVEEN